MNITDLKLAITRAAQQLKDLEGMLPDNEMNWSRESWDAYAALHERYVDLVDNNSHLVGDWAWNTFKIDY